MILPHPLTDSVVTLMTLDETAAKGDYLAWLRDPEVNRFLESRFRQFDEDQLARFIRSRNACETCVLAGIFFEQRHVGNIKLEFDVHHRRGELGLMIGDKAVWGRGVARRAIALISDFAFLELPIVKLCASCYKTNVGSLKAFEAVGFVSEATRRNHYIDGDRRVDGISMARFHPNSEYAN
jgi:ribosomal-protein-alanine N-acetyltransferase